MVNITPHVRNVLELIPMWQRPNNVRNDSVTGGAHALLRRKHEPSATGATDKL